MPTAPAVHAQPRLLAIDDDPVVPGDLRESLRIELDDATVGSLVAALAHGGNNRLTVILSCLDLLAAADIADPDLRSSIALATGATNQLAAEFQALLGTVRRQRQDVRPVALDAAVARVSGLDAFLHARGVTCDIHLPPDVWLDVDRERLDAALLRMFLLTRRLGVRALRIHGALVHVEQRTAARPVLRPGRYCQLGFEWPEGTALPHELLRPTETGRLFERLAAPAGLDFAAVEAFVLAQRGHVAARPVRDGGAIVELFLPVVNARS